MEVTLNLDRLEVPGRAASYMEALLEERAVHPLDEAVGARHPHACGPMLDVLDTEERFVGMLLGAAAEFAAVVGEDGADEDAERLVEGEHAIVEEIARGYRQLGRSIARRCGGRRNPLRYVKRDSARRPGLDPRRTPFMPATLRCPQRATASIRHNRWSSRWPP